MYPSLELKINVSQFGIGRERFSGRYYKNIVPTDLKALNYIVGDVTNLLK